MRMKQQKTLSEIKMKNRNETFIEIWKEVIKANSKKVESRAGVGGGERTEEGRRRKKERKQN